jgi:alpha-glucuronidase
MIKFIFVTFLLSTLYCYAQDVVPDSTFGIDGIVLCNINNYDAQEASSIAIQKDNKIVITGWFEYYGVRDFVTCRFNTNGSLDPTFNNDGIVITSLSDRDIGASVVIME